MIPPSLPLIRSVLLLRTGLIGILLLISTLVSAQAPKPADEAAKPSAFRLPDGTVIFFSKTPNDPNLPPDGVLLSPKDYQALLESAEQLRKLKETPSKAVSPGSCQIQARIETRGSRMVALLKFTIGYKTLVPKSLVALGGGKAQATAARLADGRLPVLVSQEDGLAVLQERAGTHVLELELEALVLPRGSKGELGFEVGLPRAAISSLAVTAPTGINRGTLIVRSVDRPTEVQSQTLDFPQTSFPLGAAEYLSVTWAPPGAASVPMVVAATAEVDLSIRADEAVIEAIAQVRLRGMAKEWSIQTPPGAEVTLQKSPTGTSDGSGNPWLTRPTESSKPVWSFRPPDGTDWTLLVTSRQTRPRPADPKFPGPYPIGPISVLNAVRQTGTVKLYAPRTLAVRTNKLAAEFRPQDVPAEEDLRSVYRFSTTKSGTALSPPSEPWLELEARTLPSTQRVQPSYTLARLDTGSTSGWRIQCTLRITPPLGGEVNEVTLEVPSTWLGEEFGPLELISSTIEGSISGSVKQRNIQLQTPQKSPFDLTLSALIPAPLTSGTSLIVMPQLLKSLERNAQVVVQVPEGLQLRGLASEAGPVPQSVPLQPGSAPRPGASRVMQATLEKGLSRLELSWQPYRPDLTVENRAEITLQPRQVLVEQTLRLRTSEGELKPIRLRGPDSATGWNFSANVESLAPGEWLVRPPAEAKDWTFNLSFAVPIMTPDTSSLTINLAWVELATRTDSQARIWGGGFPNRLTQFVGAWRELPPEPQPDRPAFPWLTLSANGPRLPIKLEFAETTNPIVPNVIDRALVQAVIGDDGAVALRTRFLFRRWSASGLELEVPPNGVVELVVDGRRMEAVLIQDQPSHRVLRLNVPPPSSRRSSFLLEVMSTGGVGAPDRGQFRLIPPRVLGSQLRSPPRWLILSPRQTVGLLGWGTFEADLHWSWAAGWPSPSSVSNAELEQWLLGTSEETSNLVPVADGISGRQTELGPVDLWFLPRIWWLAGSSLLGFLLAFGLFRLRSGLLGFAFALLTAGAALLILFVPQPTNWLLLGMTPGIFIAGLIIAIEWVLHWYYLRRITHLPGFRRRTRADDLTLPSTPPPLGRSTQPHEGSGSQPRSGSIA